MWVSSACGSPHQTTAADRPPTAVPLGGLGVAPEDGRPLLLDCNSGKFKSVRSRRFRPAAAGGAQNQDAVVVGNKLKLMVLNVALCTGYCTCSELRLKGIRVAAMLGHTAMMKCLKIHRHCCAFLHCLRCSDFSYELRVTDHDGACLIVPQPPDVFKLARTNHPNAAVCQ